MSLQRGNNSNKKNLNGIAGTLKTYLQNVIAHLLHCCSNPYFNNCVVVVVVVGYVASFWWDNWDLRCLTRANGTSETRHRHHFVETTVEMSLVTRRKVKKVWPPVYTCQSGELNHSSHRSIVHSCFRSELNPFQPDQRCSILLQIKLKQELMLWLAHANNTSVNLLAGRCPSMYQSSVGKGF